MEEEEAFKMLKHILFTLEFRNQFKPDMIALQVSQQRTHLFEIRCELIELLFDT